MRKFKLIKSYPNSPKLGTIVDWEGDEPIEFNIFNYPEFWEEIIEYTPYVVHRLGENIQGVTRLTDNVYFNKGMRIKMPNYDGIGFIYGFKLIDGKLKIDHTFSYLMDKAGIKDHLGSLRPCLYTKEDLNK